MCGNSHVSTGACQNVYQQVRLKCLMPNTREIQCEYLWVNVSEIGQLCR